MQHLPCSIPVSPSLNLPVLRAPQQGMRAPQSLATFRAPPCRSSAASRRHPPLRLVRAKQESSAGGDAEGIEGEESNAEGNAKDEGDFFDRTIEQKALHERLDLPPTGILVRPEMEPESRAAVHSPRVVLYGSFNNL